MIIFAVIALAATFFIGAAIGHGEFIQIYLLFFAIAALIAVFGMGSRYWMLIPISFSLNLPAIPFRGRAFELPELTITACSIIFACRYAINTRGVTIFRWPHASVILYTIWAAFIFALHPVGMMVTGSSTGGARFYFKIALALASFLIVANQKISERDARWIIRLLVLGSVVNMTIGILEYKLFPALVYQDPNTRIEYYTWHQSMALPAYWFMLWLVSRYKIKEIFGLTHPWAVFVVIVCIGLAAISGKRAGFASVLLLPLIAAILRKEYSFLIAGTVFCAVLVFVLTAGQGTWFNLPLQVQRSLSYLPGNWDWEVRSEFQTGIDPFRQEMRELAWKNIEQRPFFGQGYGINRQEIYGIAARGDLHMFTLLSLALGSSWHNTWLGIWADFGLPPVIFWAIFWIQAVSIGFWCYRETPHASPLRTLVLMLLLSFIIAICRSWTSGHSADDAFSSWWMFGVLVSLRYHTLGTVPSSLRQSSAGENRASELVTS
jgi:O-antigen ligase